MFQNAQIDAVVDHIARQVVELPADHLKWKVKEPDHETGGDEQPTGPSPRCGSVSGIVG